MKVEGFNWDSGNREKCHKHGISVEEIEAFFLRRVRVAPDLKHSHFEERFLAIGRNPLNGRPMIVAFTFRGTRAAKTIRPISARYMHGPEARRYEEAFKENEDG